MQYNGKILQNIYFKNGKFLTSDHHQTVKRVLAKKKRKRKKRRPLGIFLFPRRKCWGRKKEERKGQNLFFLLPPLLCARDPFCHSSKKKGESGGKKLSFFYMCENGCRGHFLLLKTFFCTFVYVGWRDGVGGIFWQTFFLPCLRSLGRREKNPLFCRKTHCHV